MFPICKSDEIGELAIREQNFTDSARIFAGGTSPVALATQFPVDQDPDPYFAAFPDKDNIVDTNVTMQSLALLERITSSYVPS